MRTTLLAALLLCLCLPPCASAPEEAGTLLSEARADFDGDGKPDLLALLLTEGGPAMGEKLCDCDEVLEGTVVVRATFSDGRTVVTPLNPFFGGRPLRLCARPWKLAVMDYDRDGRKDFNLGQLDDCNAWRYRLFRFGDSGAVEELSVPGTTLRVCDRANSTANIFRVGNQLQYTTRTGGLDGFYETINLRWDPKRRFFVNGATVARVPVIPPGETLTGVPAS